MIQSPTNTAIAGVNRDGYRQPALSRLSSKRRLEIAEHLLDHGDVGEEYVHDIVACVSDMIAEFEPESRLSFILKIHGFILKNGYFIGKDTFRFFSKSLLASLNGGDTLRLADKIAAEISPNHVLSCEAHAWALSYILPHVNGATRRKEFLQTLLNIAQNPSLHTMVKATVIHAIHLANPEHRGDLALFVADGLKGRGSAETKGLVIGILDGIVPALGDTLRVDVADSVAPLLFHANSTLVCRGLEFFADNIALLPPSHRHPFAQMIMVLANDPALGKQAGDALEHVIESLHGGARCVASVQPDESDVHSGSSVPLEQQACPAHPPR